MLEKILFQKNSNFIYTRYTVNELKMEVVCIIVFGTYLIMLKAYFLLWSQESLLAKLMGFPGMEPGPDICKMCFTYYSTSLTPKVQFKKKWLTIFCQIEKIKFVASLWKLYSLVNGIHYLEILVLKKKDKRIRMAVFQYVSE